MSEKIKSILDGASGAMEKAISHLETELAKIRAGRANPSMFDNVHVDYYGSNVPLSQVANINTQDARTIVIQPWEKSMLTPIEKAIQAANLGFNPQNDGVIIRIVVPPLTEDRRKELVRKAKQESEDAKVGIRSARKDAMDACKKLTKDGVTEDEIKDAEGKIQNLTDSFVAKCDKHMEQKEKEIMTI